MSEDNKQNLPELTDEKATPFVFSANPTELEGYKRLIAELMINPDKPEPEPEALLTLNGTPILWRGCKSFVCAVAKARKTTTLTLFAAILCGKDETARGFYAMPGCRVLYIDTEQARTDSQRILNRVAQLCNCPAKDLPLNVLSLNKQGPDTIRGIMEAAIIQNHYDAVILDNWTDCVSSVMDDKECTDFSRRLRMLAEVYNVGVFSVIHANESTRNDEKPNFRGWGAEEARKSDLTLFLKDMGDYSKATFGRCRGRKPEGFCVSIDTNGLPYLYNEPQAAPVKNPDKYADIVTKIPDNGITYGELQNIIREVAKVELPTTKAWISRMITAKVVCKNFGRYYRSGVKTTEDDELLPF